jgi:hypothetical protein
MQKSDYFGGWDWPERKEKDGAEHYLDLKALVEGYYRAWLKKDYRLAAAYAAEIEPHAWNARLAARKKVAQTEPVDLGD